MTRITKATLNKNITRLTKLENVVANTSEIQNAMSNFIIESQDKLKGPGYDAVRKKLSYFVEVLEKEKTLCNLVQINFTVANKAMLAFMGEFNELDTLELPTIEKNLSWFNKQINDLSEIIAKWIKEDNDKKLLKNLRNSLIEYNHTWEYNNRLKQKLLELEEEDNRIDDLIMPTSVECSRLNEAIQRMEK